MVASDHFTTPATTGHLLTDAQVAQLLGTALQTVRNWRWRGEGPRYVKLGERLVRYRPEDVAAFIEQGRGA